MSGVLRRIRERQGEAEGAERVVELGAGCRLWVRPLTPKAQAKVDACQHPQTRAALIGQGVIIRWEGVVVRGDLRRWRPAMRPDGTLPFSADNAGLLFMRASAVRAAVESALAAPVCSDNVATT